MKVRFLLIASALTLASTVSFAEPTINLQPKNADVFNKFVSYAIDEKKAIYLYVPTVTPDSVLADYKANASEANNKYMGSLVRIKTEVTDIKQGVLNTPYIKANGEKQAGYIAIYTNPENSKFENIKKGSKVDLVCVGEGLTSKTPTFNSCTLTSDFEPKISASVKKDLNKAIATNKLPKLMVSYTLLTHYLTMEEQITKACEADQKTCNAAIDEQVKSADHQQAFAAKDELLRKTYPNEFKALIN